MPSERLFIALTVEHDGACSDGYAMDRALHAAEMALLRLDELVAPCGLGLATISVAIDEMFPESRLPEYLKEKPCLATSSVA
jgi:hypothetical protein